MALFRIIRFLVVCLLATGKFTQYADGDVRTVIVM